MAELTPIPAEHRRAYYDALLAGRDEARRRGYHMLDDRIFIEFHRALYRPMVELIVADTRRKVAEELKTMACCDPDSDLQCCCCDELRRAIAIARGSGNGNSGQETS